MTVIAKVTDSPRFLSVKFCLIEVSTGQFWERLRLCRIDLEGRADPILISVVVAASGKIYTGTGI